MHSGLRIIFHEVAAQRSYLFHWAPVFIAVGVWVAFTYGWGIGAVCVFVALCVIGTYIAAIGFVDSQALPILVIVTCVALGAGAAIYRSYAVWGPSLSYPYSGDLIGRVVLVDRSAGDNMRLTLDQVSLGPIPNHKLPRRVRVSFAPETVDAMPDVGDRIRTTAYVSAPQGPVEPGGFDFRRHAYFLSLGAIGYGRKGFDIIEHATPKGTDLMFARMQAKVSALVDRSVSTTTQGVARAIIAGDRYGVTQDQMEHLRRSNLAHLLAISGLHMGLLTGLVFFGVRVLLVLLPWSWISLHAKSVAACAAIVVGALYLGMSGSNIATQRAFVMISAFYGAAILNRQVMSYRALAMAAMVILVLRPEALFSPGFQMSFAATTALVFVFQTVIVPRTSGRVLSAVVGVFLSSFVAGLATAPIAAIHFNQISHVGFFANLVAVPVMSAVVAPSAVVGMILAPVGGEAIGFLGVEWGLRWILYVAEVASNLPYAVSYTVTPAWWGLPIMSIGALMCVLWHGRGGRLIGVLFMGAALLAWAGADRADVLISREGRLIGAMTPYGQALSTDRGDQFTADIWMENDGVRLDRETAHGLWGSHVTGVQHYWSKCDIGRDVTCKAQDVVVSAVDINIHGPCTQITPRMIERRGAIAIWRDQEGQITDLRGSDDVKPHFMWRHTVPPFDWIGGSIGSD